MEEIDCRDEEQRLAADNAHHKEIVPGLSGHCDGHFDTMHHGSFASIIYLVAVVSHA